MAVKREYVKEIAAAHRAGDLDTLMALAIELAGCEAHFRARLEADAERKRRSRRFRTSEDVTGRDVTGRDITDPAPFSPGPPFSPPTTTATATARDDEGDARREAAARADLIMKLGGGVDAADVVARFSAAIPDRTTVYPWLTGIATWLRPITGGKGFGADVMIEAMTDWMIADRFKWPWEGRKLRAFARDIERARDAPPRAAPIRITTTRSTSRPAPQQQTYPKPSDSEADVKWQTP